MADDRNPTPPRGRLPEKLRDFLGEESGLDPVAPLARSGGKAERVIVCDPCR